MLTLIISISLVYIGLVLAGLAGFPQATAADPSEDPKIMRAIWHDMLRAANAHDVERYLSYLTEDIVLDVVPIPPPANGKEEAAEFFMELHYGFPDIHWDVSRTLISDNILVVQYLITGTHLAGWSGIQPTGSSIQIAVLDIFEFEGGKVKHITSYFDKMSMLVELGVIPSPELPPLVSFFKLPDPEPTRLSPLEAALESQNRWNAHDLVGKAKMQHQDDEVMFAPFVIPMDRVAYAALQGLYFLSSSELLMEHVRLINMGNGWVFCECVWKGINDGPYFGIPATGRHIEIRGAILYRFNEEGLETNIYVYFDNVTILEQMGATSG